MGTTDTIVAHHLSNRMQLTLDENLHYTISDIYQIADAQLPGVTAQDRMAFALLYVSGIPTIGETFNALTGAICQERNARLVENEKYWEIECIFRTVNNKWVRGGQSLVTETTTDMYPDLPPAPPDGWNNPGDPANQLVKVQTGEPGAEPQTHKIHRQRGLEWYQVTRRMTQIQNGRPVDWIRFYRDRLNFEAFPETTQDPLGTWLMRRILLDRWDPTTQVYYLTFELVRDPERLFTETVTHLNDKNRPVSDPQPPQPPESLGTEMVYRPNLFAPFGGGGPTDGEGGPSTGLGIYEML